MAGPLYELFFGSAEVEFESDYSLAESVKRLQEVSRALSAEFPTACQWLGIVSSSVKRALRSG